MKNFIKNNLPTFSKTIEVKKEEIDNLDHVNNVVYVQWVNDIAIEHWQTVATEKLLATYDWFMIKHSLEYKGAAVLGNLVKIITQVGRATNIRYERLIEIRNAATDQLLVKSISDWCAVDKNGKPLRISDELRAAFEI
ncbi:MAG: acyl-ACP thioesterase domain-containing protein [Nonlabens sp.]